MSIENIKKLRELTGAAMLDVKKALEATNQDIEAAIKWLREQGIAKSAKKADRIAAEGIVKVAHKNGKVVIAEINSETDFVASNDKFVETTNKIVSTILNSNAKTVEEILNLEVEANTINDLLINLTAIIGEKITFRRFEILDVKNKDYSIYVHSNSKIGVVVVADKMEKILLRDIAMHIAAMNPQYLSSSDIPEEKINEETELAKKDLEQALKGKPENVQIGMINGKVNKALSEVVLLEQQFVKDNTKKIKDLQKSGKLLSFIRYEVGEGIEKIEENFADEVSKQIENLN